MTILDSLKDREMNVRDLIMELFNDYQEKKQNGTLYSSSDYIARNLISIYFQVSGRLPYDSILKNFKKKYIYNENKIEDVHEKPEQEGLGVVYDAIMSGKCDNFKNLFAVILMIHQLLYSSCPFPEFGGKFRAESACIKGSDIRTSEPSQISFDINALGEQYDEVLALADEINSNNDNNNSEANQDLVIDYINKVLKIKCRLIEIHPFRDGNGRTMRAIVNMLFKRIGLPPIYVEVHERDEYIAAMDAAIRTGDTSCIERFYYYKICDSIVELDISRKDDISINDSKVKK